VLAAGCMLQGWREMVFPHPVVGYFALWHFFEQEGMKGQLTLLLFIDDVRSPLRAKHDIPKQEYCADDRIRCDLNNRSISLAKLRCASRTGNENASCQKE
jgi:hypothetical protein